MRARKERKRRREGEAAREGGASGRRERAAREEGGGRREEGGEGGGRRKEGEGENLEAAGNFVSHDIMFISTASLTHRTRPFPAVGSQDRNHPKAGQSQ